MIFNKLLTDLNDIRQKVTYSIERGEPFLLTYLNQNCFNIYFNNNKYRKLLDTKFTVYQADLGIFIILKFFGRMNVKRIDATEMNKIILNDIIKNKIPLVIIGGNFDEKFVFDESEKRGINLVGYYNGFFKETETEKIISHVSKFNNSVVMIGMGVPRQEIFAEKISGLKVIICVGNFFEFYLGTVKRASVIFQKLGLEWFFRILTEPRRLWKRYIIGIPVFFFNIVKMKLSPFES